MQPEDTQMAARRDTVVATPHWHLIGQQWRPLHEQLGALRDAGLWATTGAADNSSLAVTISVAQLDTDFAALSVSGSMEPRSVRHLASQLRLLLDAGVRDVVVDLAEVTHCDLRLAAVLMRLKARLDARRGTLVLANPIPEVQHALGVGRLPDSFMYCPLTLPPGSGVSTHGRLRAPRQAS
jgi:anti-anti-sigma regulatory factor